MGDRSSITFPEYIVADPSFPIEFHPSDGPLGFPTSQNAGFRLNHPPRSLRSGLVSPSRRKPAVPIRFPSTASATTVATSFLSPDSPTPWSSSPLAAKFEVPVVPDDHMPPHPVSPLVASHRLGFRLFSSPYQRKDSGDLPSLGSATSLPSTPVTPNTPYFVSKPYIPPTTTTTTKGPLLDAKSHIDPPEAMSDVERSPRGDRLMRKHSSRLRKSRDGARPTTSTSAAPFHPVLDVTPQELQRAWSLHVLDQDGNKVRLGDLCQSQRTCVIFIRHFWCASCMDYVRSIKEQVDPARLARAGVKLIVISNGSPAIIPSYKRIFNFPFPLYTDPTCQLYHTLGMTLRTSDAGPDSDRGDYIRHGVTGGLAMAMKNAVKARMPLHKHGGDVKQLGGEFVLGPGLHCSYVSRMHNTRSHTPIRDVLAAAGVQFDHPQSRTHTNPFYGNEEEWMKDRDVELQKIQARKGKRRGGFMGDYRRSERDGASLELDVDMDTDV